MERYEMASLLPVVHRRQDRLDRPMPVKRLGEYCFFSALQCHFYPMGRFHAGVISIEHQHDIFDVVKQFTLAAGELNAEEGNCGDIELMESHDTPWTFGDHHAVREWSCQAVVIVERGAFAEGGRKLLFAISVYCCREQPPGRYPRG